MPRQFLRKWVNILDLAAQRTDFPPAGAEPSFTPDALTPEEQRVLEGKPPPGLEDGDEPDAAGATVDF